MKSEWKIVEKSVFLEKLLNYPRTLYYEPFVGWAEWYDISLSPQADETSKVFRCTSDNTEEYWIKCFSE